MANGRKADDKARGVRVLHISDCHLGSGGTNEDAFVAALVAGSTESVDLLLIVGDLFDHARVSQSQVDWAADQFAGVTYPVIILPGNHDSAAKGGVYDRFDVVRCPAVHVIRRPEGETWQVPGAPITVWGRPTIEHTSAFRPLAGLPTRPNCGWSIVMAHGSVEVDDEPTHRGSPIYRSDLLPVDWDYVALGHADRYRDVTLPGGAPAYYPGDTATSRAGRPGGILLDLGPGTVPSVRWRPLDW